MKIFSIVGARPQFIKAAAVSKEIKKSSVLKETVLHTGQHFDTNMSDIFFDELKIPRPDFQLNIHGGSHGEMTGKMLIEIEKAMLETKPDYVLVYGDTNSTLAGALAASKLHIPIAHVEAGLRSFNMKMPEEINRILTDQVSSILFCPTDTAVANLESEGFLSKKNVYVDNVGDVMEDAAHLFSPMSRVPLTFNPESDGFILATLHRAENTDNTVRLSEIISALNDIHHSISPVVMPLHPRTRQIIEKQGISIDFSVIEPVGYLEMIWLIKNSSCVITDSGGLQKEAYFFHKPCITMRDETEWTELVESGVNVLAGANRDSILKLASKMLRSEFDYSKNLYGNGNASNNIVNVLESR